MGLLNKFVRKILGIKEDTIVPTDRPAKSVAFEAEAQKIVDEMKVKGPFAAESESIRKNRMFDDVIPAPMKVHARTLNPIDVVGKLPPGTTTIQFLALYKDVKEGDTVFIGDEIWAWGPNGWACLGKASTGHDRQRPQPARRVTPARVTTRDTRNDHDPLLDTLIITQAVTNDTPHRNASSRQDHHRYEDTPTHHSTPSHSHSHDHSRHDDGGSNNDSGGSDTGGSSD